MEGIWYEDALNEALNQFEDVREDGETEGPIRVEIPSNIADTFEFERLDEPVPDNGRPVLKTGDGNEYPLDFEGGQFVEPESKIPLGETEDGEMQVLGGTVEVYSVRDAESDEEWPETRPNEEIFDAAFEDCVVDRAEDRGRT